MAKSCNRNKLNVAVRKIMETKLLPFMETREMLEYAFNVIVREDDVEGGYGNADEALSVRLLLLCALWNVVEKRRYEFIMSPYSVICSYGRADLLSKTIELFGNSWHKTKNDSHMLSSLNPAFLAAYHYDIRCLAYIYRLDAKLLYDWNDNLADGAYNHLLLSSNILMRAWCNKRVYVFGDNDAGILGVHFGRLIQRPVPLTYKGEPIDVEEGDIRVAFGRSHALYLMNGIVYSCGLGQYGQLGCDGTDTLSELYKIDLPSPVVCIAAGPYHSVMCTKKQIYVFGMNDRGQLGTGPENILRPTLAFSLLGDGEIIKCITTDRFTAVYTSLMQVITSGEGCHFGHRSTGRFVLTRIASELVYECILPKAAVHIVQNGMRRLMFAVFANDKGNYETVSLPCPDRIQMNCLAAIYLNGVSFLFTSIFLHGPHSNSQWERSFNGSSLDKFYLYRKVENKMRVYAVSFSDENNNRFVMVKSIAVSESGKLVIVDESGSFFEGNLEQYLQYALDSLSELTRTSDGWTRNVSYELNVKLTRYRGILPSIRVFMSPDGKNTILCSRELDPSKLLDFDTAEPGIDFDTAEPRIEPIGPSEDVEVVCLNAKYVELCRTKLKAHLLLPESEYCSAYISRWSHGEKNTIKFIANEEAFRTFIQFCQNECSFPEKLSLEQFDHLLSFAGEYLCTRFHSKIVKHISTFSVNIPVLKKLIALAHRSSSSELFKSIYKICAAMSHIILESDLIEELTDDDLNGITIVCQDMFSRVDSVKRCRLFHIVEEYLPFDERVNTALHETIGGLRSIVSGASFDDILMICRNLRSSSGKPKRGKRKRMSVRKDDQQDEKCLATSETVHNVCHQGNFLSEKTDRFVDKKEGELVKIRSPDEIIGDQFNVLLNLSRVNVQGPSNNLPSNGEGTTNNQLRSPNWAVIKPPPACGFLEIQHEQAEEQARNNACEGQDETRDTSNIPCSSRRAAHDPWHQGRERCGGNGPAISK